MHSLSDVLGKAKTENTEARGLVKLASHWIFIGLLLLITPLMGWTFYASSYDDAYITFRYAENIANGNGFVYNIGEPFLGTTTPGYALLLAALHKLLPFTPIPHLGGLISVASAGA